MNKLQLVSATAQICQLGMIQWSMYIRHMKFYPGLRHFLLGVFNQQAPCTDSHLLVTTFFYTWPTTNQSTSERLSLGHPLLLINIFASPCGQVQVPGFLFIISNKSELVEVPVYADLVVDWCSILFYFQAMCCDLMSVIGFCQEP